jgi:conjugative relaxase-like TrwC/TraI family protein
VEIAAVLSIGKLATGQADYYLEQAHGAVTRATAVSSGVEDYYLGGPEASGEWVGAGGAALGLRGPVNATELDRVLSGQHPATGEALGRVLSARVPGFDLTFSAPKSVSVLFGIGDDKLRAVLRDAHDRAVIDALGYMEREAAVTRRGPGGAHVIAGNGLVAAAFRHRTSRAGDPQLHTHVLVANLTLGADGQWSTLDGRRIYAHAKTAGYLYEARLRSLLTRELGVEWTPVRNGLADIIGVPATVLRAFSRRRADIEAELERHGTTSAAAAQVAALQTRRGKDHGVTPEQLVPEWRHRAVQLGLTHDVVQALRGRVRSAPLPAELVEKIAGLLAGPTGLTEQRATFTRRDVLQALCEQLPASAGLRASDVERIADEFLQSPRAIALATGERREMLPVRDGRLIPTVTSERAYSTPELLALERRILDYAVERQGARMAVTPSRAIDRAIERRPSLAGEQVDMVRHLTQDGDGVTVVVGPAGSGKTFALAAAREAWEATGRHVYGAAVARRAARELEDDAGIPSTSVAALLLALDRRPYSTLQPRSVLVVDEAGMLPTRELAQLIEKVRDRNVKLVLVGAHRQLAAIGARGAFRGLMARLPVIELEENRRQVAQWERDALRLVRDGAAPEAVRRYEEAGRIVLGDDAAELCQRLVADWWASRDISGALMIAERRVHVDDLNGRAHALMRACGALGTEEVTVGHAAFSTGDRVVVRRNDRALGVVNGDRGVVVGVDPVQGRVELELAGRTVALDRAYLERPTRHGRPALMHGYAITAHLAQGLTCGETFILATDQLSREAGYVALSRGREANRLYALRPAAAERAEYAPATARDKDARAALVDALGRSRAQTLAADTPEPSALVTELASVVQERQRLERIHARAQGARGRLEQERPGWLRAAARKRHVVALDRAGTAVQEAEAQLGRVAAREDRLKERLVQERAARARERAREPEGPFVRERALGRDMELG